MYQSQAESETALGTGERSVGLIEQIEQTRQVFGSDADPGILNLQRLPDRSAVQELTKSDLDRACT